MNILAIQGSYRDNGKTTTMLKHAVKRAGELGHNVNTINLFEKKLDYCRSCGKCDEVGHCVFTNDDIQEVTQMIKEADVIILAAPVYWGNVPAIVKNLFDRMVGASMKHTKTFPKPRLAGKRYILLTACHTPAPFDRIFGQSSGIDRNVKEYFKTAGVKKIGMAVCDNTNNIKEVPEKVLLKVNKLVEKI
ncbi:NADPH-dependent FMN reductase [Pseudobutyrivibrio sp. YE44]|uniref:flavodoxin family protein n=1 Tax=Pseudobutyrivibrio sp. YE44 TaxID=1520802 RepID=UPI000880CBD8|nr:flavodoxin family protein [Pseudobutyrivibrio sp. YE44]SDB12791.1 NADPH-dependent FMN reductase [Pseudobutyrivibrio sp. YE44]